FFLFFLLLQPPPGSTLFPYTTLFRSFGTIGRSWAAHKLSIGASVLWTGLHALDGVDLLYSGSIRVKQSGDALDFRIGALKQWERSEEHTSELQSRSDLVCRLLLEKKK